ncbi:MAG: Alanyl-tRNA synthetase, partial [uncultured Rubrobacteraceae bacterium]
MPAMEDVRRITKRRRRLRTVGEPHPWEPRHMRLAGVRVAESVGKPAARRNVTLGVVKHLWRSPVPFVGFYPPEGVKVTENRRYSPGAPRRVDDTDYLAGVEAHKRSFAKDLEDGMVPAGHLPGYFEVPTDEGWRIDLDLVEGRLK